MEKDYIRNLKALAGVHHHAVTKQNLALLRVKYGLTDAEFDEMLQYCKDRGITMYEEEEEAAASGEERIATIRRKRRTPSAEEKAYEALVCEVAYRIMLAASAKAMNRVGGRGWLCGTYTGSVEKTVRRVVRREFTCEQLKFIVAHLEKETQRRREGFALKDPEAQDYCDVLSAKLNGMIPALYVNGVYLDLWDEG